MSLFRRIADRIAGEMRWLKGGLTETLMSCLGGRGIRRLMAHCTTAVVLCGDNTPRSGGRVVVFVCNISTPPSQTGACTAMIEQLAILRVDLFRKVSTK